jgi:hypothetical protein
MNHCTVAENESGNGGDGGDGTDGDEGGHGGNGGAGGGIYNTGVLTLTHSAVISNTTGTGGAGGRGGDGASRAPDSDEKDGGDGGDGGDGYGGGSGGGIYNFAGTTAVRASSTGPRGLVTLIDSTVAWNRTGDGGGGGDGGDGGDGADCELTTAAGTDTGGPVGVSNACSPGDGGEGGDGGRAWGGGYGGGIHAVGAALASRAVRVNGVSSDATVVLIRSAVYGNTSGDGGEGGLGGTGGYGGDYPPVATSSDGDGEARVAAPALPAPDTTGDGGDGGDGGEGRHGGGGGGVGIGFAATVVFTNTTISGNTAGHGGDGGDGGDGGVAGTGGIEGAGGEGGDGGDGGDGGGIGNYDGTSDLTHCTVSNNTTGEGGDEGENGDGSGGAVDGDRGQDGDGGGIYELGEETTTLENSLLAGNTTEGEGPDCYGPIDSGDYNLVGNGTSCDFDNQPNDQVGTGGDPIDLVLGPLALNAPGDTKTHALLAGSPAIDYVPPISCTVATDQRGVSRPQGEECDVGAYEAQPGTIVMDKVTDPAGDPQLFLFATTGDDYSGGFSLRDLDPPDEQQVMPGVYSATEDPPDIWELTNLGCVSDLGSSSFEYAGTTVTITLQSADIVTCTFTNTLAVPRFGESTDSLGTTKDEYTIEEIVYATGSGFPTTEDVHVHVVTDTAWSDQDPILPDVSGGVEAVSTDDDGNLGPAAVWLPETVPGEYDMVFDVDKDGVYDEGLDVVDDPNHPGFVVLQPVGGEAAPVDRVGLLAPWLRFMALAAAGTLATVALVLARRRPA